MKHFLKNTSYTAVLQPGINLFLEVYVFASDLNSYLCVYETAEKLRSQCCLYTLYLDIVFRWLLQEPSVILWSVCVAFISVPLFREVWSCVRKRVSGFLVLQPYSSACACVYVCVFSLY